MSNPFEELRKELQATQFIEAGPLRFERGYRHTVCNGPAERAHGYPEAYCLQCSRTVPVNEVVRD